LILVQQIFRAMQPRVIKIQKMEHKNSLNHGVFLRASSQANPRKQSSRLEMLLCRENLASSCRGLLRFKHGMLFRMGSVYFKVHKSEQLVIGKKKRIYREELILVTSYKS
jgi:DNA-binding transcriptional regulator WhiA